jgi:hypothetical protein
MPDERWEKMVGVENVDVQAQQALRHARWALHACPHDRLRGAFRVLAGRSCSSPIKGENERVATFKWARSLLGMGSRSNARTAATASDHSH